MKVEKNSPTDQDIERINSQLDFSNISSVSEYQAALRKFMNRNVSIRQTSNMFKNEHTLVRVQQVKLFKQAGGKSLKKDRKKTHKIILADVRKYKKKGARRSDLIGLDTARKFAYLQGKRRMIANNKTKIVTYKPIYTRIVKGNSQTVKRKVLQEVRVYDKRGKRLSLKKIRK